MRAALKLTSGGLLPVVGLGTWKSKPGEVGDAVFAAIKAGYRHIDCAAIYKNEKEVGEALQKAFSTGLVKREELFITSKVFNHKHGSRVPSALEQSLKDLNLDYLDLYLMHWPFSFENDPIPEPMRDENGIPNPAIIMKVEYLDTWKELEKLYNNKKVRSIGVSNFTIEQLTELISKSSVVPSVNQVEAHPYLTQVELKEYCSKQNIVLEAYSPLGSRDSYSGSKPDAPVLLNDAVIVKIAEEVKRTPAQVLIRWSVNSGFVCLPKSSNAERIAQNLASIEESWNLSEEQMERLNGLNRNYRYGKGWMPGQFLD